MKVQRCPSCGARYNADRLAPGAVFACNRCGADVAVEATGAFRPGLLAAGFLVLAALFLWSPAFEVAGMVRPWDEAAVAEHLLPRIMLLLWAVLGLWLVLTALVPAARRRSATSLGLALVALLVGAWPSAKVGFPLDPGAHTFHALAAASTLMAGLGLVALGRRGLVTTGLLLAGAVGLLAPLALGFDADGTWRLGVLFDDIERAFRGSLPSGKDAPAAVWGTLVPSVAICLVAAGGLLVALGLRARLLSWGLALLLLLSLLLPAATRVGEALSVGFAWDRLGRTLTSAAGSALVADGVALFVVLWLATVDLVQAEEVRS